MFMLNNCYMLITCHNFITLISPHNFGTQEFPGNRETQGATHSLVPVDEEEMDAGDRGRVPRLHIQESPEIQ